MNWLRLTMSDLRIDPSSPSGISKGGKPIGWIHKGRYWRMRVNGKAVMCHVVIMELKTGEPIPEGLEVDHINRNGLDNSIENLRLVDRQTNVCNTGCRKDSKTGVKGVSYREGRLKPYSAHKQRNGIRKCISFETLEEAVKWLDN